MEQVEQIEQLDLNKCVAEGQLLHCGLLALLARLILGIPPFASLLSSIRIRRGNGSTAE